MSYELKLADSVHFSVEDDTVIDRTILPLTIFGKSDTIDCGEAQQNNFYYLLETYNSADNILAPTPGMIWFDKNDSKLKIYTDASVWKHILLESDTVERLEIVDQLGNTQRSSTYEMLTANRIWPKTSSTDINNYTWYRNNTVYATETDVIVPTISGTYSVTYFYSSSPANTVYLKSIDYKVRSARPTFEVTRSITIISDTTPLINTPLEASLYDSIAAIRDIDWQWTWNGEVDYTATTTQYINTYTPIRPGAYTVTATYKDLNSYEIISVSADITIN